MTDSTQQPDNARNGCRAICSVYGFHVFDCPNHEGDVEVESLDPLVVRLIETRERARLSQRQVSRVMGTSTSSLCTWERGEKQPTLRHLRAWAAALGYDLTLTGGES
jgi:DNA-binding XRE family transcriptional regulator